MFKAIYQADDGYCGGSRPQSFKISRDEIEDDMTRDDLTEMFEDMVQDDFEQKVRPSEGNYEEFIEWALEIIENREDD